ncbi:hypothetical protein [Variovorax paradoxus]|uniref:Uncharacterized protein n=1 Tax=Variovorax paradoxus TaxID=34073 RepID=A0A679JFT4_VARPD|nr:hypothetical protein VVAX_04388 [Variovorax paradoxus]
MSDSVVLDKDEIEALTGYQVSTKQLDVLRRRGFHRAFINRKGLVVLERTHYEAVSRGEVQAPSKAKTANLSFLRTGVA